MSNAPGRTGWLRLGAGGAALAGAAAYVLFPSPPLALVGVPLYVAGAALRPLLALQLVILSAPFYVLEKQAASLPLSPTEFLLLGALAGWLLRQGISWATGRPPLALSPSWPDWPVLLFVLGALAASFAAPDLPAHARGLRTLVLEPLAFYWLLRHEVEGEEECFALLGAFVLGGALAGLHGIYQYLFTTETIFAEGISRARGLYGSPNNLGLFLGRVLPVCLCLGLWGARHRLFYAAALLPVALALALTFSIGAWLGVAGAVLFIAVAAGHRRLALGLVVVATLAVLGSYAFGLERVTSHLSPEGNTWRWRGYVWQAGLAMLADHPFFGVGLDNFLGLYERYMSPDAWPEPNLSHPHNFVLDFWLSTGLVGLAGGLWLLTRPLWRGLRLWRRRAGTALGAAALGLAAAGVETLVHGAFDNSYFLVDLALVFWLGQALLATLHKISQSAIISDHAGTVDERRGKEGGRGPDGPQPQLR